MKKLILALRVFFPMFISTAHNTQFASPPFSDTPSQKLVQAATAATPSARDAGCPLRSFDRVLDYINDTKTQTGLTVQAHLVSTPYPTGAKAPDAVMETLNIQVYDIYPNGTAPSSPEQCFLS